MSFAFLITKATNTQSEYLIFNCYSTATAATGAGLGEKHEVLKTYCGMYVSPGSEINKWAYNVTLRLGRVSIVVEKQYVLHILNMSLYP